VEGRRKQRGSEEWKEAGGGGRGGREVLGSFLRSTVYFLRASTEFVVAAPHRELKHEFF